jgi:septum formation protein
MRKIILASNSPRRRELLKLMGLEFEVVPSNFDEYLDENRSVQEIAKELALGKALDVAKRYPEALVIGADTIPTLHGRQLGKFPEPEAARELLRQLSGQAEEVFSSIALVCVETGFQEVNVAKSAIVFAPYTEEAIDTLLATEHWQDKAAATAIQSPASPPVDHIEGDFDTVLGLSTRLLSEMLKLHGIDAKPVNLTFGVHEHLV